MHGVHQVRILVLDNYKMCPVPLSIFMSMFLKWAAMKMGEGPILLLKKTYTRCQWAQLLPIVYWCTLEEIIPKDYSPTVKEWKTPLLRFRVVPHTALRKEWWLFHSFRGVSHQDRVKITQKDANFNLKEWKTTRKRFVLHMALERVLFHSF